MKHIMIQCVLINAKFHCKTLQRGDLNIPRTKTVTFGPRSFEVAGPTLWNSLPVNIRNANSLPLFKKLLKTFLFIKAYGA